jgi:hypothetical protein
MDIDCTAVTWYSVKAGTRESFDTRDDSSVCTTDGVVWSSATVVIKGQFCIKVSNCYKRDPKQSPSSSKPAQISGSTQHDRHIGGPPQSTPSSSSPFRTPSFQVVDLFSRQSQASKASLAAISALTNSMWSGSNLTNSIFAFVRLRPPLVLVI